MRKREPVMLKNAATDSIVLAVDHFNRAVGPARVEASLIFAQRALELLLKAVISERTGSIREKGAGHTYSFKKCLNVGVDQLGVVDGDERISLQALEGDRDAAMHHLIQMDEPLLYIKLQSAVTIFGSLLNRAFDESLLDYLPSRALPVSAQPPATFGEALDTELTAMQALLAPNRRQSTEAKARLRALLNLEAAAWARTDPPTEKELDRALRRLREGRDWKDVFPGVATLQVEAGPADSQVPIALKLTRGQGVPVRRAQPDEEREALLYREVNPLDRHPLTLAQLTERVGLTSARTWALMEHLRVKDDPELFNRIPLGGDQYAERYSPAAVDRMRAAAEEIDMDEVWREYSERHRFGRRR